MNFKPVIILLTLTVTATFPPLPPGEGRSEGASTDDTRPLFASMLADQLTRQPTGRLHLTFTERSPLSSAEELHRRDSLDRRRWPDGRTWLKKDPADYDLAAVPFDVYVPPNYKPDKPLGLFVWMGVTEFPAAWCEILARHKLIFVASNKNAEVIDAVDNLKKLYTIDDNRVYLAGFSDGARFAAGQLRF
jgi:hypothetical protein